MDLIDALYKACNTTRDALIDSMKIAFSAEPDWWEKRVLVSLTEEYEKKDVPETEDLSALDLNLCYKILNFYDKEKRQRPNMKRFTEYYQLRFNDFQYLIGELKHLRNLTSHLNKKVELEFDVYSVGSYLYTLKKLVDMVDIERGKRIHSLVLNIHKQPRTVEEIASMHNISVELVMKYVYEFKQEFVEGKIMADADFDSKLFKALKAERKEEIVKVPDAPASNEFVELIKGRQIFFLSDVLMNSNSELFMKHTLIPALRTTGKQIYILESTLNTIIQFIMLKDDREECKKIRQTARYAYRIIEFMYSNDLCSIIGEEGDSPFESEVLVSRLDQYKEQITSPLIFTENTVLAKEIKNIYKNSAEIYYIKSENNCKELQLATEAPEKRTEEYDVKKTINEGITHTSDAFTLHTDVVHINKEIIPVRNIPFEGDTVISEKFGNIVLEEEFAGGGEGIIYKINLDGYVAKIYRKEKITEDRFAKIKLMMSKNVNIPQLCWPCDILTNTQGEFVGYIMNQGKGIKLYNLLVNMKILKKYFSDWDRRNLVKLSITILNVFKALHEKNILAGDINLYNILVESDSSVYFVDCDSYQVEQYQSTVGIEGFIAPEIYEKMDEINGGNLDLNLIMRTPETENFAISALIFHILFLGQSPYASVGDESIAESTRNRSFDYPFGDRKGNNAPAGVWRFIWSHLNYQMKEMFDGVFCQDMRFDDNYLISKLKNYLYDLENRTHLSHELIPQTYKETSDTEFVTLKCTMCHKEYNTDKESSEARYFSGQCPTCRRAIDASKKTIVKYKCIECGNEFNMSQWEVAGYKDSGLHIPEKCIACRYSSSRKKETVSEHVVSRPAASANTATTPTYKTTQQSSRQYTPSRPKKPSLTKRLRMWYRKHAIFYTLIIIAAILSKRYIDMYGMEAYKEYVKLLLEDFLVHLEEIVGLLTKLISNLFDLVLKIIAELIVKIEEILNQ